jgi:predicted component of type VI protein secretion system
MHVELIVKKGPAARRRYRLRSRETIIGRQKGCDLRIPSAQVSRRHCLLSYSSGQLTVEDLGSVNGTFINNVPVAGKRNIRSGDQLTVGPLTFEIQISGPPVVNDHPPTGAPKAAAKEEAPAFVLIDQEEAPAFQLVEEEESSPKPVPAQPESDAEPIRLKMEPEDEEENIEVVLDENQQMTLPEGDEFRDFLSKMDH